MIKLCCLIKSVAYEHLCETWLICTRKIFINNIKQMSCMSYKQSECLQDMIYNDDDCWSWESHFFTEFWLWNVLMIESISSQRHYLYSSRE